MRGKLQENLGNFNLNFLLKYGLFKKQVLNTCSLVTVLPQISKYMYRQAGSPQVFSTCLSVFSNKKINPYSFLNYYILKLDNSSGKLQKKFNYF